MQNLEQAHASAAVVRLKAPDQENRTVGLLDFAVSFAKSRHTSAAHLQSWSPRVHACVENCNRDPSAIIVRIFVQEGVSSGLFFRQKSVNRKISVDVVSHYCTIEGFLLFCAHRNNIADLSISDI